MNKVSKRLIAALKEAKEKGLVNLKVIPNVTSFQSDKKIETDEENTPLKH